MASPAAARRLRFHTLRVAEVTRLCDDASAVTFDVPSELAPAYAFAPGQSLTLRRSVAGRQERRSYSICSPAGARPRIGVREVPDGLFSTWLVHDVRVGDPVEVATPIGTFTPEADRPGRHAAIVAGSGITPVLSIAASVLRHPATTMTLLYGNRRTDTVMFAEELADLKDRYPSRLELVHVLSREPREPELFSGRLDRAKLTVLLDHLVDVAAVDHWWLCGPWAMVTSAEQVLGDAAVPPERIRRELFYVDEPPAAPLRKDGTGAEPASRVTVVLDGRSTTVDLPVGLTVLDGAQRGRPDLPFACKGGVCGTCRAQVISGRVEMRRNFALEPSEVEAGFVLTCQSVPASPEVTVDYDR